MRKHQNRLLRLLAGLSSKAQYATSAVSAAFTGAAPDVFIYALKTSRDAIAEKALGVAIAPASMGATMLDRLDIWGVVIHTALAFLASLFILKYIQAKKRIDDMVNAKSLYNSFSNIADTAAAVDKMIVDLSRDRIGVVDNSEALSLSVLITKIRQFQLELSVFVQTFGTLLGPKYSQLKKDAAQLHAYERAVPRAMMGLVDEKIIEEVMAYMATSNSVMENYSRWLADAAKTGPED